MGPDALQSELESVLGPVHAMVPLRGGDIARAYRVESKSGVRFVKAMEGPRGAEQLHAEAAGLEALAGTGAVRTPGVEGVRDLEGGACLILEFILSRPGTAEEYRRFGSELAAMHALPRESFGWPEDNFIGTLPQPNSPDDSWARFFATQRLQPQYDLALRSGLLNEDEVPPAGVVARWFGEYAAGVQPALLHGDFWGGNHLFTKSGRGVLIDPAVYSGHSEVDLAMSRLFGGYPPSFYEGYYRVCPGQPGEAERVAAYQLYYLLVHLNLFGASYASRVRSLGRSLFGVGG